MTPVERGAIRRNSICMLLGIEPMTFRELQLSTGWGKKATWHHLRSLVAGGYVSQVAMTPKFNRPLYGLSLNR